jgi:hypothetical protein
MGVIDNRKVTPGITESSPARAHIDLEACYFDVVSPHPGGAAAAKWGCSPIKADREMGLDRRETGLLLTSGSVDV